VIPGVGDTGRIVVCKRAGLRACCREELPTPRPSPATLIHSAACAHVAARLERDGRLVLSEYEIAAHERAERKRIYSAQTREGRHHRPDLVVLGNLPEAIEVELSDKSNRRLDGILRCWRWAVAEKRFSRVRYLCSPRAMPYVTRAAERMHAEDWIEIERLEERGSRWVLAGPRSPFARV
jgi:hypothetical protein